MLQLIAMIQESPAMLASVIFFVGYTVGLYAFPYLKKQFLKVDNLH